MNECITGSQFEIIAKAKQALLDSTNIDTSPKEMACLDDFLFRCWQMGWLDAYYFMELVRCLGIKFMVEGDIIKVKWRHGDKHYIVPFGGLLELWEKYKEQEHE